MSVRSQTVLQEALKLPPNERADVAAELLASLDEGDEEDPDAVAEAWAIEIEKRLARFLSGESRGESWPEVRRRIERDLKKA